MGMIRCDEHGLQGLSFVPVTLRDAVLAGEAWTATRIVRVFVDDGQYPRSRRWLDRSVVGDLDDQMLSLRLADEQALEIICFECLYGWLRARGVDVARSPEEQRFERLKETLTTLLRPRLEPNLQRICDGLVARTGIKGLGFSASRGRPFEAYVETDVVVDQVIRSAVDVIRIAISDQLDHLIATATIAVPDAAPPADVAGPIRIELAGGELDAAGLAATAHWADVLASYLLATDSDWLRRRVSNPRPGG